MKKKSKKGKKIILGVLAGLLVAVLGFCGFFALKVKAFEEQVGSFDVKKADMFFDTYGDPENPTVLMVHGMYMDGKMLADYCNELSEKYYLIVPTMHGMEGNQDTVFDSIDNECAYIEDYIKTECGGHIEYAYGISMGATTIYNMLERKEITIDKAILDGIYVADQGPMAAYMTSTNYYDFHEKALAGEDFDLGIMTIACKLMGITEEEAKDMVVKDMTANHMTYENMSRAAYACYTYEVDPQAMITDTEIALWCGSDEPYAIKSHNIIKAHIANYTETLFDGYGHGELLSKHREEFVTKVESFFAE